MTGITAEKHDSFITPTDDGHVMMEFSGKELIKASRTHPHFHPAAFALPLKPGDIRFGTVPHRPFCGKTPSA